MGGSTETEDRGAGGAERDDSLGAVVSRLGPAAWLAAAWTVTPAVMGILLLTNMEKASEFLSARSEQGGAAFLTGVTMYIGIFIVSAGVGMLPTYSQAILAGYAFGVVWGLPAAILGFTGASLVGYLIAKTVARSRVEREIHAHPKAEVVRDSFVRHGFWRALGILVLLRVPPTSPFALMNGVMAVSGVRVLPYTLAAAVGMAPRTFAAVWIGSGISDWGEQERPRWMIVGGIVLTIAIVVYLGKLANDAIARATRRGGDDDGPDGSDPEPGVSR